MGQGASSTRCPSTGALRQSQFPSPGHDMSSARSRDPQPSHPSAASDTTTVPSRRRSFSPDPDSIDSRRSNRIRRRISRFVSSNIPADNVGRDPTHPSLIDTTVEPNSENISTSTPRVRLARIRSSLLHRRRPLNPSTADGTRRERPFSMITPRLESLPFHTPRDTGSLDMSHSRPLGSATAGDSDPYRLSEPPMLTPPEYQTPEARVGDGSSEALRSERSTSNDVFTPRRNISNSRNLRPRRTYPETFNSIAEGSQTSSGSTSTTSFSASTQSRSGLHRSTRDSRGSSASPSPRLGRSGEDQAAVLSRLLSVAAAATAASLVGSNVQAFSDARDVSGDSVDGSFESFLRALQNGRLASALRNGGSAADSSGSDSSDDIISTGSIGPLNFFRMFRFGPTSANSATPTTSTPAPAPGADQARMIPVIIVGIRSVNPRETSPRDGRPSPPFLDALPTAPPPNEGGSRQGSSPGRPHPARSLHLRTVEDSDQSESSASNSTRYSSPTSVFSSSDPRNRLDTRSTHLSESLGTAPSDSSTTSSEASEWTASSTPSDDSQRSLPSQISNDNLPSRSASPDLNRQSSEGTRSWIIYVLGGSYPENHPILTTPSLFTDTPTYEDMMLLSSLIAPAKPPVASREDVESAGGLFTVQLEGNPENNLGENTTFIRLHPGERCLVCLSDFEAGEISRQLVKCQHIFHKDCIDEWLTTGRNSCPLCRGKGVEEGSTDEVGLSGESSAARAS